MPIYEYRCSDCGVKFEKRMSMSASNSGVGCPDCGGSTKRLVSNFAALSKSDNGQTSSVGGGCAGCSSGNCAGCHH
jgi:putative FmdB family regulatory protein